MEERNGMPPRSGCLARPHKVSQPLDAETRSIQSFARMELQTSASPTCGWPHLIDECGTRASAQVARRAFHPAT